MKITANSPQQIWIRGGQGIKTTQATPGLCLDGTRGAHRGIGMQIRWKIGLPVGIVCLEMKSGVNIPRIQTVGRWRWIDQKWEDHEIEQMAYLWLVKNCEKITKNPSCSGRPSLWRFPVVSGWSQVGHCWTAMISKWMITMGEWFLSDHLEDCKY